MSDGKKRALPCAAVIAEITGCFEFWAWLRLGKRAMWALSGTLSLIIFAMLLTRTDAAFAGRAFTTYGGVYIAASLIWLWAVEDMRPDRFDLIGALVCIGGGAIILLGRRLCF